MDTIFFELIYCNKILCTNTQFYPIRSMQSYVSVGVCVCREYPVDMHRDASCAVTRGPPCQLECHDRVLRLVPGQFVPACLSPCRVPRAHTLPDTCTRQSAAWLTSPVTHFSKHHIHIPYKPLGLLCPALLANMFHSSFRTHIGGHHIE